MADKGHFLASCSVYSETSNLNRSDYWGWTKAVAIYHYTGNNLANILRLEERRFGEKKASKNKSAL